MHAGPKSNTPTRRKLDLDNEMYALPPLSATPSHLYLLPSLPNEEGGRGSNSNNSNGSSGAASDTPPAAPPKTRAPLGALHRNTTTLGSQQQTIKAAAAPSHKSWQSTNVEDEGDTPRGVAAVDRSHNHHHSNRMMMRGNGDSEDSSTMEHSTPSTSGSPVWSPEQQQQQLHESFFGRAEDGPRRGMMNASPVASSTATARRLHTQQQPQLHHHAATTVSAAGSLNDSTSLYDQLNTDMVDMLQEYMPSPPAPHSLHRQKAAVTSYVVRQVDAEPLPRREEDEEAGTPSAGRGRAPASRAPQQSDLAGGSSITRRRYVSFSLQPTPARGAASSTAADPLSVAVLVGDDDARAVQAMISSSAVTTTTTSPARRRGPSAVFLFFSHPKVLLVIGVLGVAGGLAVAIYGIVALVA